MDSIFLKLERGKRKLENNEFPQEQVLTIQALLSAMEKQVNTYYKVQKALLDHTKTEQHSTFRAWIAAFESKAGKPDISITLPTQSVNTKSSVIVEDIPFTDIIEPTVRKKTLEKLQIMLSGIINQIEHLDTVPENWTGTNKEYKESVKSQRDEKTKSRDDVKSEITKIKNGVKTEAYQNYESLLSREQNNEATKEQIELYITELERTSFEKVRNLDYYPTPNNIAEIAVELANIEDGMSILEPSAGKGNIADILKTNYPESEIDVCEYSEHNRRILQLKGYNIVGTDFLQYGVVGRGKNNLPIYDENIQYDRIVMNPPYQQGIDWVHVEHAYNLLKTGGELVAIVPANSYIGIGKEAIERQAIISEREGKIDVIEASVYNEQMEFTQLTINIGIITMRKQQKLERQESNRQRASSTERFSKQGEYALPKRQDIATAKQGFVKPEIVPASAELMPPIDTIPDYVSQIRLKKPASIFPHQYEGINRAIHGLLNNTGFLLADGTGAGKSIQMLLVGTYFYQKYKKPVALFTIDERVIQTSFMPDGIKIGLEAPNYVPPGDLEEVKRPNNYPGLYDKIEPDSKYSSVNNKQLELIPLKYDPNTPDSLVPKLYAGNNKTLKLENGINMFRYKALETTVEELEADKHTLKQAYLEVVKNDEWWYDGIYKQAKELLTKDNAEFQAYLDMAVLSREDRENGETNGVNDNYGLYDSEETETPGTPKESKQDKEQRVRRYKEYSQRWASVYKRLSSLDGVEQQREAMQAVGYSEPCPYVKAKQKYVKAQNEYEKIIEQYFSGVSKSASLLIWDEAHKIKNQLLATDKNVGRAYYAKFITKGADYVLFATATPADRPYDIMYLERIGLYTDEIQFRTMMNSIGVNYRPEKRNEDDEVIERPSWSYQKNPDAERYQAFQLSSVFNKSVRMGGMIRREIQYTNLDAKFVDTMLPYSQVKPILEDITKSLTKADANGRMRVDKTLEYQRHLEALEEFKVDNVIDIVQEEISEGRNVVIFTNFVDEGKAERDDGSRKFGTVRELKSRLSKMYGEDSIGILVGANSPYEKYKRMDGVIKFQSGEKRIMIGTIMSGGTGVNLDDVKGDAPRTMIVMTAPLSFINVMQGIGRVVRANTQTRSKVVFLFGKLDSSLVEKQTIPVESWLKNLIGNKFRMLKATVKGEIEALNPNEVAAAESNGENAVNLNSEVVREHSQYTFTKKEIKGWELPNRIPFRIIRYGTTREHYCVISAKSQEIMESWASNNKEFIQKYGLVRNIDKNYQRYNGTHYGAKFYNRDAKRWTESYELWNAMLNIVLPEEIAYLTSQDTSYNFNEEVVSNVNFLGQNIAPGETGIIIEVISNLLGIDKNESKYKYLYTIKWDKNQYTSTDVEAWQIKKPGTSSVPESKYKVGDVYKEINIYPDMYIVKEVHYTNDTDTYEITYHKDYDSTMREKTNEEWIEKAKEIMQSGVIIKTVDESEFPNSEFIGNVNTTTDTLGDSENGFQLDSENNIESWQGISKKTGKTVYYAKGNSHYDTGKKGAYNTRDEAINAIIRERSNTQKNYDKMLKTKQEYETYLPLYINTIKQFKIDKSIPEYIGYGNGHKAITTNSYYHDIHWSKEEYKRIKIRISDHYGNEAVSAYDIYIVFGSDKYPAITPEDLYYRLAVILQERISPTLGDNEMNNYDAEYFSLIARYSGYIYEDIKRNWSSWNFGAEGFTGTKSQLEIKIKNAIKHKTELEISGISIPYYELDISKYGELYKNYWVLKDIRGKGISTHLLKSTTIKEALEEIKNNPFIDGAGDGTFIDMASVNPEVVYSQYPEGQWGLHIISIDEKYL